jgi:hypothetical protein
MPDSRSARAVIVTTLLCMLPPSVGSGWQTIASTGCGVASAFGQVKGGLDAAGGSGDGQGQVGAGGAAGDSLMRP